mgnify:CR=1 FL=1
MTGCGCQVKKFPEPTECQACHQIRPVDFYQIVYCPLHAQAEAMRDCLRQCAEGAFVMEQRGELINLAKAVLANVEGTTNATR